MVNNIKFTVEALEKRVKEIRHLTGKARLKAGAELLADLYDEVGRLQAVFLEVRGLLELDTSL